MNLHPIEIAHAWPMPLPLFARAVPAGFPSPADDFIEEAIDLQALLIRNRSATFLFRVSGDSMVGKGLFDGDLAVVDRSLKPQAGDIVVVDVDGERSFKVWGQRAGRVLSPLRTRGTLPSRSTARRWSRSGASSPAASTRAGVQGLLCRRCVTDHATLLENCCIIKRLRLRASGTKVTWAAAGWAH